MIVKTKELVNFITNLINDKKTLMFFMVISTLFCFIGYILKNYNTSLVGILIIYIYLLIYAIVNWKNSFLLLVMYGMIFTFILSRPTISMFRGEIWWKTAEESVWLALFSIFVTLIFIMFGYVYISNNTSMKKHMKKTKFVMKLNDFKEKKLNNLHSNKFVKRIILVLLIVTCMSNYIVNINTYIGMQDKDYALLYSEQTNDIPKLFTLLSEMYVYVLCFYLANSQNKKWATINLIIYLLSGLPLFLIGNRGALIAKMLFVIIYMYLSKKQNDNFRINKCVIISLIIFVPILIIGLSAYNYTRSNQEIPYSSPVSLFVDFFYKQGTTFDTICEGFEYKEELRNQEYVISYTFGEIIDYLKHSTISQIVFHTEGLGSGNNMVKAEKSNNMAHHLSYLYLGKTSYLSGHGRGSSYILETYIDFGIVGLAIFSFCIGLYLAKATNAMQYNYIANSLFLITLTKFFLIPRSESMEFLSFIVQPQFILVLLIVLFAIRHKQQKKVD